MLTKRRIRQQCRICLKDTFGLDGYRPGQKQAIETLLSGRDLLCILPTGAGKSLCWQLPAVVHDGLTVVVSPLIALMRDQVRHLREKGIPAVALDSLMLPEEREDAMRKLYSGAARIVFLAPERLVSASFRTLCRKRPPWLVVIDEAHCVVQWGGEFRPAYAGIGDFIRSLQARPVMCAMTATADRRMQRALTDMLGLRRPGRVTLPIVRENLIYEVRTTLDAAQEIQRIAEGTDGKAVVYCRTRARTEQLAKMLCAGGVRAASYHAGMNRDARSACQERFVNGSIRVLTATTAFGMGVDIPDIRCVIHDEPPASVTDYVQQSGRAGRDGQAAACILLIEPNALIRRGMRMQHHLKKLRWRPIRLLNDLRRDWRPFRQLLRMVMTAKCIPSAAAKALGSRAKPCGCCSACRKGALIRRIPPLLHMSEAQMIAWFLRWQRQAIAEKAKCHPADVISDALLERCARLCAIPAEAATVPEEFARIVNHFRRLHVHKED